MNFARTLVFSGVFLLVLALTVAAAAPPFINYQGRLTDADGEPVTDGIYSAVFRIYDDYTAGTELWSSGPVSISVQDGLFSTILGEIGSSVFVPSDNRFLGITVGTDPELVPRTWLTTVPYAYGSVHSESSSSCPAWSINGGNVYHSGGYVGIGEPNPREPLVIGKDLFQNIGDYITISDTSQYGECGIILGEDASHFVSFIWQDAIDQFTINHAYGTGGGPVLVAEAGNIGLGTFWPAFQLHVLSKGVGDGMRVDNHSAAQMFRVRENSDGSCEIQVSDNTGAVQAMIRGNGDSYFLGGDIGIGTTSPNYTLDVRGTIGNNTTLYHSDERWKKDIVPLKNALESVTRLRGVSYDWRQDEYPDMNFPSGRQIGFIAQEVEEVVPEVVSTGDDGYKSIDYAKLMAVMAEAIKSQQEQIEILSKRIAELERGM